MKNILNSRGAVIVTVLLVLLAAVTLGAVAFFGLTHSCPPCPFC